MDLQAIEDSIPESIYDKIEKLSSFSLKESDKSVHRSRTITILYSICNFPQLNRTIQPIDLCCNATVRPKDALEVYTPMQVQAITYLVKSLYDDPTAFAIAISALQHSQHFSYIASIVVPSVFGFFSTNESLEQAMIFYLACGSHIEFEQLKIFLRAFFGNPWTIVFRKIAIENLMKTFYFKKPKINEVIRKLYESISENLCYFPQQLLYVLDYIVVHFGIKKAYQFVVEEVIVPHLSIVMKYTPITHCSDAPVSKESLINEIKKCDESYMDYLNLSKQRISKFSPPARFAIPEHPLKLFFIFTPFDIYLLTQLSMDFPRTIRPICTPDLLRKIDVSFTIEISVPHKKVDYGVIASNVGLKKTQYLEALIASYIDVERIIKWNEDLLKYQDELSFCSIFALRQPVSFEMVEEVWKNAFNVPSIGTVRFWNSIAVLDQCEKATIKPLEKKLFIMEQQWTSDSLVLKMEFKENPALSIPKIRNGLIEVSSLMQLVTCKSRFADRFIVFIAFLKSFWALASVKECVNLEPTELLETCFVLFDPLWIIRTHVFIMAGAMRDQSFCTACPNEIYDLFMMFTPCLLTTLSVNPNTADKLTDMISTFLPLHN